MKDINEIWKSVLAAAAPKLPSGTAEIWLNGCLPLELNSQGTLKLDAGNDFVKKTIEERFQKILEESLIGQQLGKRVELIANGSSTVESQPRLPLRPQPPANNGLNPNYVFSSFVIGKSNRLAHAASLAVAESPGAAYNPLFIWGGVGLGKTHLMHAIGHYALDKDPNLKVSYVSSEKFTNELITAIKNNKTADFRAKYRHMDILLIDDIQFLAGKESTQEEFFHTFNSLHDDKKQIVLSSDRPPKEISDIEERLVSRFEWGLVTDIQQPDYETRIAILKKKAETRGCMVPDEVINYLAQNVPNNIRELEGALNRIIACAELNSEPMTVDNAQDWLKDVIRSTARGPVNIDTIQQIVAEEFGLTVEDLVGSKRTSEIALARQVAMYICRKRTDSSLQQISLSFSKKDHTTVLHAQRKIDQLVKDTERVRKIVENIERKL